MAVGGAPQVDPKHAENVADAALCLIKRAENLKLPTGGHIQIRIGKYFNNIV